MAGCLDVDALVEKEIDRIATEYRESPKLIHVMRVYLREIAEAMDAACALPSFFDLDTAVGDQLTIIGKRLGFPRTHCVCATQPVFGFNCDDYTGPQAIAGFCDANVTWENCGPFGTANVTIHDDEMYRAFLKVRRYQMLSLYDHESLEEALQIFWGSEARILHSGSGRIVVAPGRELTHVEKAIISLYPRVLPVAPGIRIRFHFGNKNVFGFGEGWLGFCQPIDYGEQEFVTENGDTILVTSLGPNTTTNGTFDANVTGWGFLGNGSRVWNAGKVRVASDGTGSKPRAYQSANGLTIGKKYCVTFDVDTVSAFKVAVTSTTSMTAPIAELTGIESGVGKRLTFIAPAATVYIQLSHDTLVAGEHSDFDNVMFQEVVEEPLVTGLLSVDPPWMCEVDVDPYDCNFSALS